MSFDDMLLQVEILELFTEAQYLGKGAKNTLSAAVKRYNILEMRKRKETERAERAEVRLRRVGRRFARHVKEWIANSKAPLESMHPIYRSTVRSICSKCRKASPSANAAKWCCQ